MWIKVSSVNNARVWYIPVTYCTETDWMERFWLQQIELSQTLTVSAHMPKWKPLKSLLLETFRNISNLFHNKILKNGCKTQQLQLNMIATRCITMHISQSKLFKIIVFAGKAIDLITLFHFNCDKWKSKCNVFSHAKCKYVWMRFQSYSRGKDFQWITTISVPYTMSAHGFTGFKC